MQVFAGHFKAWLHCIGYAFNLPEMAKHCKITVTVQAESGRNHTEQIGCTCGRVFFKRED